ncbi:kinase-like domain-containing protein [Lasiosphaeria ovina]|uniref:Kinase-like domain-containing protein n=1 Tax=Lasiosphaeria ovina TaxID=92902 RepID=A0AAE0TSX1_9PEZI|nr:kinase-like domain-containing protein [Lasiosphaeria ovina]
MGQETPTTSETDNINTLLTKLDESLEKPSYWGLHSEYIPADAIDQLITVRSVLDCVGSLLSSSCPEEDAKAIVQQAKKTFAILIISGCESVTYDLIVREQMKDQYLPLSPHDGTTVVGTGPDGPDGPKAFKAFASLKKRQFFNHFRSAQWQALAPMFGGDIQHLELGPKQPLPIRGWDVISPGTDSYVVKSALHPAHHNYNSVVVTSSNSPYAKQPFLDVAIKKLIRKCDFKHEHDILVKTRALDNPHLIKHMATYEVRGADGSEYYIIFPWADGGDLRNFWETKTKSPRTPELVVWSLEQMLGIATAIQHLHQGFPGKTHCRHGDLKPRNIFHFTGGSSGITTNKPPNPPLGHLVIADLGISRIHDNPTFERDQLTGTKATTPAYEPPEALHIVRRNNRGEPVDKNDTTAGKPWSRKYDMWSLGCIFLEFVIWLFHDLEGLDGFGEQRGQGHFYAIHNDNGKGGGVPEPALAVLCPKVKEAMGAVREDERNCGGATATEAGPLGRLVDLIEKRLLVIEAEGRCDANELVEEMNGIVDAAKRDPGKYFGGMLDRDRDMRVPAVFMPRRGWV